MDQIVKNVIEYSAWYIGQLEKPGNSGFKDASFQREMEKAGWRLGDPWCASFGKLIYLKVFINDPVLLAAVKTQFNASARETFNNVKRAGIFETGDTPEPGAIVVYLHGKGPSGHEGIVESVDFKINTQTNIEGNTNASGSREGDRVARKLRTIKRDFNPAGLNVLGYIYPRRKK
nr:CHAP domain-containing protein [Pedobacter sp. ASV19]